MTETKGDEGNHRDPDSSRDTVQEDERDANRRRFMGQSQSEEPYDNQRKRSLNQRNVANVNGNVTTEERRQDKADLPECIEECHLSIVYMDSGDDSRQQRWKQVDAEPIRCCDSKH